MALTDAVKEHVLNVAGQATIQNKEGATMKELHDQHFCHTCQRPTLHTARLETPNHVLHLLISVFTCGLWLPVWLVLIVATKSAPWRCSQCGGTYADDENTALSFGFFGEF